MHSNAKYTSHLRQKPDNQLQYISCYMMRIHISMHIIYIVHAIHIQHLIQLVSLVSYQLNLIVPFSSFASISIRVLHIIRGLCDFPALGAAAACVEHCGKTKLSVGSLVRSLFGLPFSHEEARGTSKNSTLGVSRNHESQHFEEQTRMDA